MCTRKVSKVWIEDFYSYNNTQNLRSAQILILWHFFLGCNVFFHVPPDQTLIYRDAIPQISLRSPVPILRLYMGKSREWAFGEKQKFHMGSNVTKLRLVEEAFTVGFKKLATPWICLVCFRNKLDRSDFLSQFKKEYLETVQVQLGWRITQVVL